MKRFKEFLNENTDSNDNLFVTFELIIDNKKYYILAQANNTQMQATFTEDGEKIDNFTTEYAMENPDVTITPLDYTPQPILDTLKKMGVLDNLKLGKSSDLSPKEDEPIPEPKQKSYVEMGQKELNYQLNIDIDNNDWKTAKEISTYLKESLTDQMKGKSVEDVEEKLKGLKASDKYMAVRRYKLDDKYYPTDTEWEEEMKNSKPSERMDLIRRFELSDKFRPTDEEMVEELKTLDGMEQVNYIRHFNLSGDLIPDHSVVQKAVIKEVYDTYPTSSDKHPELKEMVIELFDNGYVFSGVNIEDDNRERQEKKKGYDVVWFKYPDPKHFFSFRDNSSLSEVKDRINRYKKRYSI